MHYNAWIYEHNLQYKKETIIQKPSKNRCKINFSTAISPSSLLLSRSSNADSNLFFFVQWEWFLPTKLYCSIINRDGADSGKQKSDRRSIHWRGIQKKFEIEEHKGKKMQCIILLVAKPRFIISDFSGKKMQGRSLQKETGRKKDQNQQFQKQK